MPQSDTDYSCVGLNVTPPQTASTSVLKQVNLSRSALSSLRRYHTLANIMKPCAMSDQFWINLQVLKKSSLGDETMHKPYFIQVWPEAFLPSETYERISWALYKLANEDKLQLPWEVGISFFTSPEEQAHVQNVHLYSTHKICMPIIPHVYRYRWSWLLTCKNSHNFNSSFSSSSHI